MVMATSGRLLTDGDGSEGGASQNDSGWDGLGCPVGSRTGGLGRPVGSRTGMLTNLRLARQVAQRQQVPPRAGACSVEAERPRVRGEQAFVSGSGHGETVRARGALLGKVYKGDLADGEDIRPSARR